MSALGTSRRVVDRIVEAINSHDPDAVAAQYAGDAVAYDPQYPEPLRGREAIREDYVGVISSFPDLRVTVSSVLVSGNDIAYEILVSGTNLGPFATPAGAVPATNRRVEVRMGIFAEVDAAGIILSERRYYDPASLLQQLGLSG